MSISTRQEEILKLLDENISLSVEKLSELIYASPSSIRRDLTKLQNMQLIKRVHGGASILNEVNRVVPFRNRMEINTVEKKKIAKKAASLICDGQYIMLDASSTANFLIPHIAKHKDVTIFTYNIITAMNAINHGISTRCIGGCSINGSPTLTGAKLYQDITEIHSDILFFSLHSLDKNGIISSPSETGICIRRLMLENTDKSVFLCTGQKFNQRSPYAFSSLDDIDAAVFDVPYPELKTKCKIL